MALALTSCATGQNQVSPLSPVSPQAAQAGGDSSQIASNRQLWGFWIGYIPPSNDTIEFMPVRSGEFHLNARRFLEDTVCKNCLKLVSLEKDFDNMVVKAQIELTHPFAGLSRYTAFDVRGIVISDGSRYFPALDVTAPDALMGDFTLLNPDGFTRLWNTVDFPPGSGPFKILEYSQGKFATSGTFTGTVNPYIEFTQDPRSSFPAGGSMTKEFRLTLKPGGGFFGYAIDASWEAPTVDPPVDLMTDFPDSANAAEPYITSVYQDQELADKEGASVSFTIEMADRQIAMPSSAQLECPALWSGAVEANIWGIMPGEPLWNPVSAIINITNETGAGEGTYPAMVKVVDSSVDPYLGDINHRYMLTSVKVNHVELPVLNGKIVFVAPGPPDPNGTPGALNVFLLDVDTMQQTQITDFVGYGAIFEEPRINPEGTHILISFSPGPASSVIRVYEIGGSDWTASPLDVFDGQADFDPDGEHILVASGPQFMETKSLVSMKYDGSERTIIATGPVSISHPRWSPDRKKIVFSSMVNATPIQSTLWLYDAELAQFSQFMNGPYMLEHPSWSPVKLQDHYMIVYDSTQNDPWGFMKDIYIANPDTGENQMLVDNGGFETHPSFSPDGKAIVFSGDSLTGTQLYAYGLVSQETTPLTFDEGLNESPSWCWGW
jgi:Tol biopolymer transport system component